jgi:PEP-CTERM motif
MTSRRILHAAIGAFLAATPCLVKAQTIINDGGTHTINGPSGPIEVLDGSTVNLNSGAMVTGGFVPGPLGYTASVFADASSTINLNGGQVFAPVAPGSPAGNISGIGIFAEGSFTASGGQAEGGMAGNLYQDGGWGLLVWGPVQVSGGTFQGGAGNGGGNGAYFVNLDAGVSNNLSITGGTFQGGDATSAVGGGGSALSLATNGVASVTGGTFIGGLNGASIGGQGFSLTFSGGGGSVLNVAGGLFSGPIESLLMIGDSMNFFGQGFQLQDLGGTEWLSGTLADGTALDVQLYIYMYDANSSYETSLLQLPNGEEELRFVAAVSPVPEPSSWLLLALGGIGLAIASRRASRRSPALKTTMLRKLVK